MEQQGIAFNMGDLVLIQVMAQKFMEGIDLGTEAGRSISEIIAKTETGLRQIRAQSPGILKSLLGDQGQQPGTTEPPLTE